MFLDDRLNGVGVDEPKGMIPHWSLVIHSVQLEVFRLTLITRRKRLLSSSVYSSVYYGSLDMLVRLKNKCIIDITFNFLTLCKKFSSNIVLRLFFKII